MSPLFALINLLSSDMQDLLKMVFSTGSLIVTVYFWFVRSNRERVSVGIHQVGGFEGSLHPDNVGLWSGRLFLANRSIMPTAIVAGQVEVLWYGKWLSGRFLGADGHELPWNLSPTQVYAKAVCAVFNLGPEAQRDQVYEDHRLRFTFVTIEGTRVRAEIQTNVPVEVAA